ncbi:WbqC family protein [Labilibaculum antarcticum]|uniref:WbqC-like protein n=1 Tax=Labilibaculum antarcticum TaxID=1717717 RepID=A0A1Y1CEW6_9BACT|nr:WbqC family protein [Labilibaculum antarcticum]BAX78898.1 hypothetical protein ALGA_0505 [Labilibaculum antarcticum]
MDYQSVAYISTDKESPKNKGLIGADMLAIMQPYVFPYIGYFQLIEAASEIVFYDDVNYIKRGWVNRNRILLNGSDFLFTIPVSKGSQNKKINEVKPIPDEKFKRKLFLQMKYSYSKAPYYKEVIELIENVCKKEYENIGDMGIASILAVHEYLHKTIKWSKSSICSPLNADKEKADRLIDITKQFGYKTYVNTVGGRKLYQKEYFKDKGIDLYFIKTGKIEYAQAGNKFIPNLSIIDILMFNDKQTILRFFKNYILI